MYNMNDMTLDRLIARRCDWRATAPLGRDAQAGAHIVGLTLGERAQLHIIERRAAGPTPRRARSRRAQLLAQQEPRSRFLDSRCVRMGGRDLRVELAEAEVLAQSECALQLFMAMLDAGWAPPERLRGAPWGDIMLTTLTLDARELPAPGALVVRHAPLPKRHAIGRSVTLRPGRPRALEFDCPGRGELRCIIGDVRLFDPWAELEASFADARRTAGMAPGEVARARADMERALAAACPRGMRHMLIEYECELGLDFYSKQYLRQRPGGGARGALAFSARPERALGAHGLPLRSCVLQDALAPDVDAVKAELLAAYEPQAEWAEAI